MISNIYQYINKMLIVTCPHCDIPVEIEKLNCGIFRHGTYKNGKQVDPHMPKDQCLALLQKNLVYGCMGPFRIVGEQAEKCDYI